MAQAGRLRILLIGFGGGLLAGLLGVGGGIVLVPAMVMLAGVAQHRAHGTSLAAIPPIVAAGAVVFGAGGEVHAGVAALVAAGAVIGAPLGVRLMSRVPERGLTLLFVAVMIASGVRLLL